MPHDVSGLNWMPPDVGYVTAYLTVPASQPAVDFYAAAFGFELGEAMRMPDGELAHASMRYRHQHVIMMSPESAPWVSNQSPVTSGMSSPVGLYLYCPDVDALINRAVAAGAELVSEPHDEFWGDRIGTVKDPFGYEWTISTKVGEFDESKRPQFA